MEKRYSKILKQKIAIDKVSKKVFTEDGSIYTKYELDKLKNSNDNVKLICHVIKNIFKGRIMK